MVSSTVRNTNAPHQVDAARVDCLCQGCLCFEFSLLDHIAQLFDGICLVGLLGRHQLVLLMMGPRPLRIWVHMKIDKPTLSARRLKKLAAIRKAGEGNEHEERRKPAECGHKRRKNQCNESGGGVICEQKRTRSKCRECGRASASTIGGGL